jgi:RNA polymerase sigma-70 factor (ECF subfamily)
MVLARCRYLLGDGEAARDAAQEVFVAALRSLPEFRAAASPTTWLTRIAINHCLNLRRASQAAWPRELARLSRDRHERGIEPDRRELVRALLGAAPAEAQEAAVLYFVDELTQAEVAEATGASLPTVRKRLRTFLSSARGALAEALPGLALPDAEELP